MNQVVASLYRPTRVPGLDVQEIRDSPGLTRRDVAQVTIRFHEYIDHDFRLKDGYVHVSDRPGLGIEVKEDHIAKLPYRKRMRYRQYRPRLNCRRS